VETDNFSAAFQFKDWWGIFRANLSGFIAAFGVYYIAAMLLAIIMQVLMATVILSCLLIVSCPPRPSTSPWSCTPPLPPPIGTGRQNSPKPRLNGHAPA
jgi:hypothetical protein